MVEELTLQNSAMGLESHTLLMCGKQACCFSHDRMFPSSKDVHNFVAATDALDV